MMSLKYMGVPSRCPHGYYEDQSEHCDKCKIDTLRKQLVAADNALESLKTAIKEWHVVLASPTHDEPFRTIECVIVDIGYADHAIVVEAKVAETED